MQLLRQQRHRLRHTGDDDDVVGPRPQPTGSGEPRRERRTQPRVPARIAVAQFLRRRLGQHRALGAQPQAPREGRQIGHARRQVDTLADRQPGARQPQWSTGRASRAARVIAPAVRVEATRSSRHHRVRRPVPRRSAAGMPRPRRPGTRQVGGQGPARGQPAARARRRRRWRPRSASTSQSVRPRAGAVAASSSRKSAPLAFGPSNNASFWCYLSDHIGASMAAVSSTIRAGLSGALGNGLRRRQRRGVRCARRCATSHRPGAALCGRLRTARRVVPHDRAHAASTARHGVAVVDRGRRQRSGRVQRRIGARVAPRRACGARGRGGVRARRAGGDRTAARGPRPASPGVGCGVVVSAGAVVVEGFGRADAVGLLWALTVFVCEAGFTLLAVPVLGRHGRRGYRCTPHGSPRRCSLSSRFATKASRRQRLSMLGDLLAIAIPGRRE